MFLLIGTKTVIVGDTWVVWISIIVRHLLNLVKKVSGSDVLGVGQF